MKLFSLAKSSSAYRPSNASPKCTKRLKASVPGVPDAELLRQGVALRMALAALDAKGEKPKAFIKYHDQDGKLQTVDLEEYVGIGAPEE